MKLHTMTCPHCNAPIEVKINPNMNYFFCSYCGSQIFTDNGNATYNLNYTYRKIDDARIREAEAYERVRIREIEASEKKEKNEDKFYRNWTLAAILPFLIVIGITIYGDIRSNKEKKEEQAREISALESGLIKVPGASPSYIGENYKKVQNEFEDTGFTNIEVIPLNDLKIGFIKKENEVDSITISGDSSFGNDEFYDPDVPIKIYYHSY